MRFKTVSLPFILLLASVWADFTLASPPALTYQGRIVKSDGKPLEYSSVSFLFQITNPSGSCIIYQEQVTGYSMANSGGVFDVAIGNGAIQYPLTGGSTVLDSFNNSQIFNCGACTSSGGVYTCADSGGTYSASTTDSRKLRVAFYDGIGWNLISPDNVIRSVPFAGYALSAQKLGTNTANDFTLKPGAACAGGSFLTFNGTNLVCAVPGGGGGGSVTDVTSANSYLTVANSTTTPALTINVGTVAGTLAAGNDSRFTDSRAPTGAAGGVLSGTYPNPGLADSTITTSKVFANPGINRIVATDNVTGSGLTSLSCAANQLLTWSVALGWQCTAQSSLVVGSTTNFTGALAGDVTGTQGATVVSKIGGYTLDLSIAPTANQVLTWDGAKWVASVIGSSSLPAGTVSTSTAGTTGYVPKFTAASTIADSAIYESGGKVGIGTNTPSDSLEIIGAANGSGAGHVILQNTTNGTAAHTTFLAKNNGGVSAEFGITSGLYNLNSGIPGGAAYLKSSSASGLSILSGHSTTSAIRFYTGGLSSTDERMRIANDGIVGIGTVSPSASSLLDIASTTKGLLIPRMTTVQRDAIGSPATGLQVYNTSTNQLNYHNGTSWQAVGVSGSGVTSVTAGSGLTGGTITSTGTIAVDAGTGANQIVQLDGSSQLPPVSGVNLTNLNASNLASGTVPSARLPAATTGASGAVTLAADGGTIASTVVQATDSRLSNARTPVGSALTSTNIWVGNGSNAAAAVAISGDATLANTGALTLAANSVNSAKINDGTVGVADLNFAGVMATNTGLLVRDGTQFYNKTCAGNETLIWSMVNGWVCSAVTLTESDPKVGVNTTNYVSKWNGSALVASGLYESGGSVGIGLTNPASKLQVTGAITNTVSTFSTAFTCGTSAIDFSTSNFQRLSPSNTISAGACGVTLSNLVAGGSYTLIVTGNAATNAVTYNFTGYSFKYLPTNAATTAAKDTIYTFLYDGITVYVTWSGGY